MNLYPGLTRNELKPIGNHNMNNPCELLKLILTCLCQSELTRRNRTLSWGNHMYLTTSKPVSLTYPSSWTQWFSELSKHWPKSSPVHLRLGPQMDSFVQPIPNWQPSCKSNFLHHILSIEIYIWCKNTCLDTISRAWLHLGKNVQKGSLIPLVTFHTTSN